MTFSAANIPDLKGKVVIVTGANTGIGKVCALELAKHGAHVVLAARSPDKTLPVVEEIKKETGNAQVEFIPLDLSSLKSVAEFAAAFKAKNLPLHLLLNNAGVMACPYGLTQDGIETQFGTNHIGHFALTLSLFDILEKSQPSRIVNVASSAHSMAPPEGVRFDKINNESIYKPWTAYGQSKVSNILFTKELSRRIGDKQIYVNTLHPGVVETDLQRHMLEGAYPIFRPLMRAGIRLFFIPASKGALTQLYLSTSPEVEKQNIRGEYYVPYGSKATPSSIARNEELAKKLWDFSVSLVREKLGQFDVPESLRS